MEITKEQILALLILFLIIIFIIRIIRYLLKTIKMFLQFIFRQSFHEAKYQDPINSNDWLVRAQARQELRFQNSILPTTAAAKPTKLTLKQKWNIRRGRSANGWSFNEDTQLWEPPKNYK